MRPQLKIEATFSEGGGAAPSALNGIRVVLPPVKSIAAALELLHNALFSSAAPPQPSSILHAKPCDNRQVLSETSPRRRAGAQQGLQKRSPDTASNAGVTRKLTWLVLGSDHLVCSHRVEQVTALRRL